MPDRDKELTQEERDDHHGVAFECNSCQELVNVSYETMRNLVAEGDAVDMFRIYKHRFKKKAFTKQEIPEIVEGARMYLIATRKLKERGLDWESVLGIK